MSELVKKDSSVKAFLLKLSALIQGGPDPDHPETFEEFNRQVMFDLAYDVKSDSSLMSEPGNTRVSSLQLLVPKAGPVGLNPRYLAGLTRNPPRVDRV